MGYRKIFHPLTTIPSIHDCPVVSPPLSQAAVAKLQFCSKL
ncbi:hypothetical protein M7I_2598 [Glarea lozoyensis 74030]|uniref:Uncharacterized protein n=1 Tax=Glarea lozoyensis (strain ATCC 74030 / MF5533) TaxID=1104152 RepID=H0EJ74_GLAL7|nr:hypothetical protein M7I_2598 [Glarea lozoyensis 74030]